MLIAIFFLIPIGWSLILSLRADNLLGSSHYIGLANYKALFKDHTFRSAVGHTLLYTVIFVPVSVVGALGLAVALNRRIRGIRFYRLAVFVPLVTSTVATGIVFLWLLDPDLRAGQLRPAPGRDPAAAVPPGPQRGAVLHHRDDRLGMAGV